MPGTTRNTPPTTPLERARACFRLKYELEERKDELALLVTRDNGKAEISAIMIPSGTAGFTVEPAYLEQFRPFVDACL